MKRWLCLALWCLIGLAPLGAGGQDVQGSQSVQGRFATGRSMKGSIARARMAMTPKARPAATAKCLSVRRAGPKSAPGKRFCQNPAAISVPTPMPTIRVR